jgi:hypothetical protein
MLTSKKIDLYRDFAAGVYLSEVPSPPFLRVFYGFIGRQAGQLAGAVPLDCRPSKIQVFISYLAVDM